MLSKRVIFVNTNNRRKLNKVKNMFKYVYNIIYFRVFIKYIRLIKLVYK